MSPIVLRQEEVIVILMKSKTAYRRLEIEDLIESAALAAVTP